MDKFPILDMFPIDTSNPFVLMLAFAFTLLMFILSMIILYIILVFFYYMIKMYFVSEDKYDLVSEQFNNKLKWLDDLDVSKEENELSTSDKSTKTLKNGFPKTENLEKEPRYKPEHDTESLPRIQKIMDSGHFQDEAQFLYDKVEQLINKQTTRKFQEEIRRIELANLKVHISSLEDAIQRLHRKEEITQLDEQAEQLLER